MLLPLSALMMILSSCFSKLNEEEVYTVHSFRDKVDTNKLQPVNLRGMMTDGQVRLTSVKKVASVSP